MTARVLVQNAHGLVQPQGPFVNPLGTQGVKNIGHGHDAPSLGNVLPGQTIRITRAIPFLVVALSHHLAHLQDGRIGAGENPRTDARVLLHGRSFFVCQASRFKQNGIRDANLAHVMHGRGIEQ